jgi:Ca-activated chloride channel family protein
MNMAKPPLGICAVFPLVAFLLVPQTTDSAAAEWILSEPDVRASIQKHSRSGKEEGYKIKVDVPLVMAPVTVVGKAVSELKAEDFTIYDNGLPQQIAHFSRDQSPLAIALLVDRSRSILPYLPMLQIAALSALRRLEPEDQVVLFSFDNQRRRLGDLTRDRLHTAEKISKLKVADAFGTVIYDAVFDAANYLGKKAPNRRRAIILISDNCHYSFAGGCSAGSARSKALEAAVTLYSIRTPGEGMSTPSCMESNEQVKRIAEDTGGEQLSVDASKSLQEAFEEALSYLRLQYAVGFIPSDPGNKGSYHELSVRLAAENRCPGCRLLARSGYYFGVSASPLPQSSIQKAPEQSLEKTDQLLVQQILLAAGTVDVDLTGIPFTVRTAEQNDSEGKPEVKVDIHIDFSRIKLTAVESRHSCKVHVAVFYADSKGKILGSDSRIIEGLLSAETAFNALSKGISYSTTIPLKEPEQMLKIVVFDEKSDRVGSKLIRLP